MNMPTFKLYAVGGYIRDLYLGLNPKDIDFVVVGATEKNLLDFGKENNLNFKKVGVDFPVYLDCFKREWALARKERKTGPGYKGFEVEFDPNVTLEEDLFRRDLTINSMAVEIEELHDDGTVKLNHNNRVDPFGGYKDLHQELLVHVSDHFKEDPVRVLRVARFAARYGFYVADHTQYLIDKMAKEGELDHLVSERVWAETEKALNEYNAGQFFNVLSKTEAMDRIFPNLREGWDESVRKAVTISNDPSEKWALATHKMRPPRLNWLNEHIRVPTKHAKYALAFREILFVLKSHNYTLTADVAEKIINMVNGYRNSYIHDVMLTSICLQDDRIEDATFRLNIVFQQAAVLGWDNLTYKQQTTLSGPEIGKAIKDLRRKVLENEIP